MSTFFVVIVCLKENEICNATKLTNHFYCLVNKWTLWISLKGLPHISESRNICKLSNYFWKKKRKYIGIFRGNLEIWKDKIRFIGIFLGNFQLDFSAIFRDFVSRPTLSQVKYAHHTSGPTNGSLFCLGLKWLRTLFRLLNGMPVHRK